MQTTKKRLDHSYVNQHRDILLRKHLSNHSRVSKNGLLDWAFSCLFRGMVYPQIWEDPEVDLKALDLKPDSKMLTISSGGCNILNYLTEDFDSIVAVDLNPAHIALANLKFKAVECLPSQKHLFDMFGYADKQENVSNFYEFIEPHLDGFSRFYWSSPRFCFRPRINFFANNIYKYGILGRSLKSLHLFSKLIKLNLADILSIDSPEHRLEKLQLEFSPAFHNKLFNWFCNLPIVGYGFGIPVSQLNHIKAEHTGGIPEFAHEKLKNLLCNFDITSNYFAWQGLILRYDTKNRKAIPRYLMEDHYDSLKKNIHKAQAIHTSLTDYLKSQPDESLDRYNFLDAQDWLSDKQLTELWAQVLRTARPNARVIFRTAASKSVVEGKVPQEILDCFHYDEDQCRKWWREDRSGIYGGFHMYELKDRF